MRNSTIAVVGGVGVVCMSAVQCLALTDEQFARTITEIVNSKGPSGNAFYDYQTFAAGIFALVAALIAYIGVWHQIHLQRKTSERAEARAASLRGQQKLAFFNILREDLQILVEDLDSQKGIVLDLLDTVGDQSTDRVKRIIAALRPRTGKSFVVNSWMQADFIDDPQIVQQLERLNQYLKQLDSVITWIEKEIVEVRDIASEQADLVDYYKRNYDLILEIVEKLRGRLQPTSKATPLVAA